jgi:phosphoribosyl 1,2-cyclic phosphodiesterase/DNA-binding response OmpR family regulator
MLARFWGTRGSLPSPGPTTVRYGGNTSCVEVRAADGTLVVLDCGTGARALGASLVATKKPIRGHLLIGHTHWDHIQGIPFFAPLFAPGNEWDVYAPRGLGEALRETLSGQMQYTYFPVALEQLGATIRYHDLVEGTLQLGAIRVTARYLNHPALTLGYRLEADGAAIVYATDHEPHGRPAALGHREAPHPEDLGHTGFVAGADVLIHDCQYTAAEYPAKAGWGHSTVEYVVDVAAKADVGTLVLFHHDPTRTDDDVDALVEAAKLRADDLGSDLEIIAAAEGRSIELSPRTQRAPWSLRREGARSMPSLEGSPLVLAVGGDEPLLAQLRDAVREDGLRLSTAMDAEAALARVASDAPALVVLEAGDTPPEDLGGPKDPLTFVRRVRASADAGADVPILVVATHAACHAFAGAFEAGATDAIARPFSTQYIRTKCRAWLMRTRARWASAPISADEAARVAAVRRLGLLDTPPEPRFDRLTRLAASALAAPVALLSLIDSDRQFIKARSASDRAVLRDIPRDVSMCAHTLNVEGAMVVPDAEESAEYGDSYYFHELPESLRAGGAAEPYRFYAGVPLRSSDGFRVGALCVLDHRPRAITTRELEALHDLAALAELELERETVPLDVIPKRPPLPTIPSPAS